MILHLFKGSPRFDLGSLSSVSHSTVPRAAPSTSGPLLSPSLPPSPTLSTALFNVSQLLQHLWAAAAGAGGSSRAGEQLLVSCPPVNHQPQHPLPGCATSASGACTTHPKGSLGPLWGEEEAWTAWNHTQSTEGTPLEAQRVPQKEFRVSF